MWASWDTGIPQTFPAHPLPVALWKCTGVRWVFYRAGCEAVRRYNVSAWWIRNCWDPRLGLGFGSVVTGVWMSLYILITGFDECFPCSVSHMKCKSPPHQNKHLFNNNELGNIPPNEQITLQWQSHSWLRGRAKVTDGNRSLLKQMMSDGSSLCAGR